MRKLGIGLAVVLGLVALGCGGDAPPPLLFQEGQLVESVLSGERGQVVRIMGYHPRYVVRFAMPSQHIPDHIFGSGGAMEPRAFTALRMHAYELRAVQP